MKVPYSMDESEPDLYGGMGGYQSEDDQWETQTKWESEDRTPKPVFKMEYVACPKFYTQEDMDKVIQQNLKAIDKLRLEIDDAYDKGYWQGRDDGFSEGYELGREE